MDIVLIGIYVKRLLRAWLLSSPLPLGERGRKTAFAETTGAIKKAHEIRAPC